MSCWERGSDRLAKAFLAAVCAAAIAGCATSAAPPPAAAAGVPENDLLNAALWMQEAVEYRATTEGLFALARLRLDEALKDKSWSAVPGKQPHGYEKLPPAIIVDCDETVLDNSGFQAALIKNGLTYSNDLWTDYVNSETAGAVPGAVAFTQYAASKGVAVFYVTNRSAATEPATEANLRALGFPTGEVDTIYAKGERPEWTSKKESRIAAIAASHRVLLLMGDNFGDFTDASAGSAEERLAAYEAAKDHWGKYWIALPNPAYGSWEAAAGGPYSLSAGERRKNKIGALKAWSPGER